MGDFCCSEYSYSRSISKKNWATKSSGTVSVTGVEGNLRIPAGLLDRVPVERFVAGTKLLGVLDLLVIGHRADPATFVAGGVLLLRISGLVVSTAPAPSLLCNSRRGMESSKPNRFILWVQMIVKVPISRYDCCQREVRFRLSNRSDPEKW
jgi:hypothetical protein